jgi:hypothetical protein
MAARKHEWSTTLFNISVNAYRTMLATFGRSSLARFSRAAISSKTRLSSAPRSSTTRVASRAAGALLAMK